MEESDGEFKIYHRSTCGKEGKRQAGRDCREDGEREGDNEEQRRAEQIQGRAEEAHGEQGRSRRYYLTNFVKPLHGVVLMLMH